MKRRFFAFFLLSFFWERVGRGEILSFSAFLLSFRNSPVDLKLKRLGSKQTFKRHGCLLEPTWIYSRRVCFNPSLLSFKPPGELRFLKIVLSQKKKRRKKAKILIVSSYKFYLAIPLLDRCSISTNGFSSGQASTISSN